MEGSRSTADWNDKLPKTAMLTRSKWGAENQQKGHPAYVFSIKHAQHVN
jgi:hypothetical protein